MNPAWIRALALVCIFGAVQAIRERTGDVSIVAARRELFARHLDLARSAISPDEFAAAWNDGLAMQFEDVIDEALAVVTKRPSDAYVAEGNARTGS